VEDLGTLLRVVPGRAGDEQVPRGSAAREGLATAEAVASLDLLEAAAGLQPVSRSRAHEHELLLGDLSKQRFGGLAVPEAPDSGGDEVLMHRQSESRGAAVPAQLPERPADLGVGRAAAAQPAGIAAEKKRRSLSST
jgi:hypothetical protein